MSDETLMRASHFFPPLLVLLTLLSLRVVLVDRADPEGFNTNQILTDFSFDLT